MNILHYNLGLSPQRSGGLTKYSLDLMVEQTKDHCISLLYPCAYRPFCKRISWRRAEDYKGVACYHLCNSFPIPLLFDIDNPKAFYKGRFMDDVDMERLYAELSPDVFHVHTLMGLPKELLVFFKAKGVRLVFTTHDYYGLGANANFYDEDSLFYTPNRKSVFYLRMRNSRLALNLKNCSLIRKILGK